MPYNRPLIQIIGKNLYEKNFKCDHGQHSSELFTVIAKVTVLKECLPRDVKYC